MSQIYALCIVLIFIAGCRKSKDNEGSLKSTVAVKEPTLFRAYI